MRAIPAVVAAILSFGPIECGCRNSVSERIAAARREERPRVPPGQPGNVGGMRYEIVSTRALARITAGSRAAAPPPGSVFVLLEYRRTWNGSLPITVPADPLAIVARDGATYGVDLAAMAVQVLVSPCGELGPSRLQPGVPERACAVFAVPTPALSGAAVEPTAAAHRGVVRPVFQLDPISLDAGSGT
jgi:hypothetical protein